MPLLKLWDSSEGGLTKAVVVTAVLIFNIFPCGAVGFKLSEFTFA